MAEQALNWNELANTRVGEVERPPLKPAGHYTAVITGRGEASNSKKKGTLMLTFPIQVQEPMDDVDAEELAAAGGANFKGEITFFLTPNSLYRFTEFGKGLGASDDLNIPELAEWLADSGEPFVVEARHEAAQDNPERVFMRLDNPTPLSQYNR